MGEWGIAAAAGALFVGLVVGYALGYRGGCVAGELAALKSMKHLHSRSRRHRDSLEETDDG